MYNDLTGIKKRLFGSASIRKGLLDLIDLIYLEFIQRIEELEQSLSTKKVEITDLTSESKKLKEEIWALNYKYNSLKDHYDKNVLDLEIKDKELNGTKKLLTDKEGEIVNYQANILDLNNSHDKLKNSLIEKEQLLDKVSKDLMSTTEQVNYLKGETEKLKNKNSCLESFYEEKDLLLKQLQIRFDNQREEFGRLEQKIRMQH